MHDDITMAAIVRVLPAAIATVAGVWLVLVYLLTTL